MSWTGDYFRFSEHEKNKIFAGVRIGNQDQRAAFIRATEGAITAWINRGPRQSPDVMKRRAIAVRDAARGMLKALADGGGEEAGFMPDQLKQARQLMEQAEEHAADTTERLKHGGSPHSEGKALAAWIGDAYFQAFGKMPRFETGTTFEKLLGNIAGVAPVKFPTDPRLLKPATTWAK